MITYTSFELGDGFSGPSETLTLAERWQTNTTRNKNMNLNLITLEIQIEIKIKKFGL